MAGPVRRRRPRGEDGDPLPGDEPGAHRGHHAGGRQHPGGRHPARRRARGARRNPGFLRRRHARRARTGRPWGSRSGRRTTAPISGGTVTGTCTAIHLGRTLTTHEIVMTDEQGRRLSTARITNLHPGHHALADGFPRPAGSGRSGPPGSGSASSTMPRPMVREEINSSGGVGPVMRKQRLAAAQHHRNDRDDHARPAVRRRRTAPRGRRRPRPRRSGPRRPVP